MDNEPDAPDDTPPNIDVVDETPDEASDDSSPIPDSVDDSDDAEDSDDTAEPRSPSWNEQQWALFALAMIGAVILLVGAAVQASDRSVDGPGSLPPEPCQTELACCIERWGSDECCAEVDPDGPGLFDAEEEFARDDADRCRR